MNKVKEIRFKVMVDNVLIDATHQTRIAVSGHKEHVWTLGKGPCGKNVTGLRYELTLAALTIIQTTGHADLHFLEARAIAAMQRHNLTIDQYGAPLESREAINKARQEVERLRTEVEVARAEAETKRFIYRLEDIVGRIVAIE